MDWTVQDLRKALDGCPDDALIWALHVGDDPESGSTFYVVNAHMDWLVRRATIIVEPLTDESELPMQKCSDAELERRIALVERALREESGLG